MDFSTQEPAGPCAPLHPGRLRRPLLVPFHTSPPSRGALRSTGVPTIAASTTPAPSLPRPSRRAQRGIWEDPVRRKGIPRVRRGVGYGRTSRSGLLLGRLGGVFGARLPPVHACRRRSGECGSGKQMWPAARPAHAGRAAWPPPVTLVHSSALKHGRLAFTGAR
ncbi:hypothetical protein VTI74DRAFT_284 [Chaetomium olivicolor]